MINWSHEIFCLQIVYMIGYILKVKNIQGVKENSQLTIFGYLAHKSQF